MLEAIGQSLPIAVSFLLVAAPMVIIAVLLVIKRPVKVTGAFLGGWVLGLAVVGGIVILVADLVTLATEPAWWASCIKIALRVLLIVLAAAELRPAMIRVALADDRQLGRPAIWRITSATLEKRPYPAACGQSSAAWQRTRWCGDAR